MNEIIKKPRDGIVRDGSLTGAGDRWLTLLGDRISKLASTAADFLSGGSAIPTSGGIWSAMVPQISQGGGTWTPDLSASLDFIRTISSPLTINFPANLPANAWPIFSVMIVQNSTGGWAVDYGSGFEGAAPVVFTNPGDRTLLGLKVTGRNPDRFTAWACKGISAA